MPAKKKHIRKSSGKKKKALKLPPPYPFKYEIIDARENPFPEKLARAREILRNCKFMERPEE